MLLTANNRNSIILANIVQTLEQIKVTGQANRPIMIDSGSISFDPVDAFTSMTSGQFGDLESSAFEGMTGSPSITYTVAFYVDEARTNLLFTDTSIASPDKFSVVSGRVFYTPVDAGLNDNPTVSSSQSQWIYYLTVTSSAGLNKHLAYDNSQNLLFKSVIVSSKPNPPFTTNAGQVIVSAA